MAVGIATNIAKNMYAIPRIARTFGLAAQPAARMSVSNSEFNLF